MCLNLHFIYVFVFDGVRCNQFSLFSKPNNFSHIKLGPSDDVAQT